MAAETTAGGLLQVCQRSLRGMRLRSGTLIHLHQAVALQNGFAMTSAGCWCLTLALQAGKPVLSTGTNDSNRRRTRHW